MRAYRMFFLCSLCAHIVMLAFAESMTIISAQRTEATPLKVSLLQQPVPLPDGEIVQRPNMKGRP